MKSIFEEMGGTYTLGADGMYYPNLELPEEEPHYGKYGKIRLHYLKENRKVENFEQMLKEKVGCNQFRLDLEDMYQLFPELEDNKDKNYNGI